MTITELVWKDKPALLVAGMNPTPEQAKAMLREHPLVDQVTEVEIGPLKRYRKWPSWRWDFFCAEVKEGQSTRGSFEARLIQEKTD